MKSSKLQWMISASFKQQQQQKKINKRFTTITTVLTI